MQNNIGDGFLESLIRESRDDGVQKVVVGAVIIYSNGNILLLERRDGEFNAGLVELPSGGVEEGETIIEALVREVREETGLEIEEINRYLGSFDYLSSSGKKSRQFNFAVTVVPGEIRINPEEHSKYFIVNPADDDFKKLNISEQTKDIVIKAISDV